MVEDPDSNVFHKAAWCMPSPVEPGILTTYLFDFNGDGKDEIYVASDDQKELRCYWFHGKDYSFDILKGFKKDIITFNLATYQHDSEFYR